MEWKADLAKLMLRMTCGGLLMLHGVNSAVQGMEPVKRILENQNLPPFLAWGNVLGEVVAPAFLIVGYKSRIAALVIVINMLLTVAIAHRDIAFSRSEFGGWMIELNVFYLMTAVSIFLLGAGRLSISRGRGFWDLERNDFFSP